MDSSLSAKKDEGLDPESLHLDKMVQFLADSDYAWENLQFNEFMALVNEDLKDPFSVEVSQSEKEQSDEVQSEVLEVPQEAQPTAEGVENIIRNFDSEISSAQERKANYTWTVGVPAIIEKMKNLGRDTVYLREAESEQNLFCTEDLWFNALDGYFAAKELSLSDEGKLYVVYNTLWNNEESYRSSWGYDEEDMEAEVDKNISDALITKIISVLMEDDVYNVLPECDEDDEDDDEIEGPTQEDDLEDESNIQLRIENISGQQNMTGAFKNLNCITLDLTGLNTSEASDMSEMFAYDSCLEKINLSSFNTSKCVTMQAMFYSCKSLQTIDLSTFDTSACESFESMFDGCESLETLDLSSFNTECSVNFQEMFKNCITLETLDISNFNTSNAFGFAQMFEGCVNLKTLNLGGIEFGGFVITNDMFKDCNALEYVDLSGADEDTVRCVINELRSQDLIDVNIKSDFSHLSGKVKDLATDTED